MRLSSVKAMVQCLHEQWMQQLKAGSHATRPTTSHSWQCRGARHRRGTLEGRCAACGGSGDGQLMEKGAKRERLNAAESKVMMERCEALRERGSMRLGAPAKPSSWGCGWLAVVTMLSHSHSAQHHNTWKQNNRRPIPSPPLSATPAAPCTCTMADRFPSLDEIDAGELRHCTPEAAPHPVLNT